MLKVNGKLTLKDKIKMWGLKSTLIGDAKFHFWWDDFYFTGDSHHSVTQRTYKWKFTWGYKPFNPNTLFGFNFMWYTPKFVFGLYA